MDDESPTAAHQQDDAGASTQSPEVVPRVPSPLQSPAERAAPVPVDPPAFRYSSRWPPRAKQASEDDELPSATPHQAPAPQLPKAAFPAPAPAEQQGTDALTTGALEELATAVSQPLLFVSRLSEEGVSLQALGSASVQEPAPEPAPLLPPDPPAPLAPALPLLPQTQADLRQPPPPPRLQAKTHRADSLATTGSGGGTNALDFSYNYSDAPPDGERSASFWVLPNTNTILRFNSGSRRVPSGPSCRPTDATDELLSERRAGAPDPRKQDARPPKPYRPLSLAWRMDDLVEVYLPDHGYKVYGTVAKLRGDLVCVRVQVSGGGWWLEWREGDSPDLRLLAWSSPWGVELGPRPDYFS